jgi:putative NADH-flavin reductase
MRLLVLGATGRTGREIVSQALKQGHQVTVFVRSPDKLAISDAQLTVKRGDVLVDTETLDEAVRGQDAVISALGVGNSFRSGNLIARSMPIIVSAMERNGVKRLVVISAFGVGESINDAPMLPRIAYASLLREVFADKEAGEDFLAQSSIDWTLVAPVMMTDAPYTGTYRSGERLKLAGLPRVPRADVAHLSLILAADPTFARKRIVISS